MIAPILRFNVKGVGYEADWGTFTPRDAADFRREVGIRLSVAGTTDELDLDVIAGFVWLIRRAGNRTLTYSEVLDSFTYADYEPAAGPPVEEDEASPPA